MLSSRKNKYLLVALLLSILFAVEVTSAVNESQIIDEGVHLSSGYAYWQKGNFALNPEHPPLAKYIAAAPLLFLDLDPKFSGESYRDNYQWGYGRELIHENRLSNNLILNLGRLPTMLLSVLLGLIIFKLADRFFGTKVALAALLLYVFDPNLIAHSRYVTTDLYITFFIFLTVMLFIGYLQKPNWHNFIWVSLALAGAALVKFSSVILIPILLLIYLVFRLKGGKLHPRRFFGQMFLSLLIVYCFIFIFYQFELQKPIDDSSVSQYYSDLQFQKTDSEEFNPTLWQRVSDPDHQPGSLIKMAAEKISVPGYSYFKGFFILAQHNHFGHASYLLGSHSNTGWWYYFPVAFLVKTPFSIILLLILAASYFIAKKWGHLEQSRELTKWQTIKKFFAGISLPVYSLLIAVAIYFGWTLTSQLNIGIRHLLPIYPFLFILIGLFLQTIFKQGAVVQAITIALVVLLLISSVLIYPNYLSYFQELVGGADSGHLYLADSNVDWGQGLIQLKKYMDDQKLETIRLHYFGSVDPRYYGVNWQSAPDNKFRENNPDWHGLVAISSTGMHDQEFSWISHYQPIAKIGYSIWIFAI
ncbi:glycosyltransferase family 39 protein [Patescibacteria group bacterium]|nr:glycosyltransferase family 39 protein [Patescibacteria group bacterium]